MKDVVKNVISTYFIVIFIISAYGKGQKRFKIDTVLSTI